MTLQQRVLLTPCLGAQKQLLLQVVILISGVLAHAYCPDGYSGHGMCLAIPKVSLTFSPSCLFHTPPFPHFLCNNRLLRLLTLLLLVPLRTPASVTITSQVDFGSPHGRVFPAPCALVPTARHGLRRRSWRTTIPSSPSARRRVFATGSPGHVAVLPVSRARPARDQSVLAIAVATGHVRV